MSLSNEVVANASRTSSPRRRARSLEEQLAMIAAGARLVPTFKPTRPTIDATLGGVSAGLLREK